MSRSENLLRLLEEATGEDSKTTVLTELAERDDDTSKSLKIVIYHTAAYLSAFVTKNALSDAIAGAGSNSDDFGRQLDKRIESYLKLFAKAEAWGKIDEGPVSDIVLDKLKIVYNTVRQNVEKIKKEVEDRLGGASGDADRSKMYNTLYNELGKTICRAAGQDTSISVPTKQQFLKSVQNNQT
jgi:hypothetical protein